MKKKLSSGAQYLVAFLFTLISVAGWGQGTLTITRSSFPTGTGYVSSTWTATALTGETITGTSNLFLTTTTNIQIGGTSLPHPYNSVPIPGAITKIEITMPGTGSLRAWTPRVSASAAIVNTSTGTALSAQTFSVNNGTLIWDLNASDNYKYFYLQASGNTNIQSIKITYQTCTTPSQSFAAASVTKPLGDPSFINTFLTNSTGAVTYSSSNTGVATVNSSDGQVILVGAGTANITASTAASSPYCATTLSYALTVNPSSYNLTYDGNGNTGGTVPTGGSYSAGSTVTVSGNTGNLIKTCANFNGWNTAANGSGTAYAPGASFTINANTTLYAQWTSTLKTITFSSNGGTGTMTTQTACAPEAIKTNTYTRTGYTFSGWNTAANGSGTAYANAAMYDFSADVTLYAQWSPNTNTITFNGNGATAGSTPLQTLATAASAPLNLNGFTRTGYTFAGWANTAGGTVAYTDGGNYTMGTVNVTLYAKWTPNPYQITFDKNDAAAAGNMANQTIAYEATASLTPNGFAKPGYVFKEWNTSADGSGTAYANNAAYTMSTIGDKTLFAQWQVGPCLSESFTGAVYPPTGWLSTNTSRSTTTADYNTGPAAAIFAGTTGELTLPNISNPATLKFYLGRSTNSSAKTMTVQVSTSSQTSGFIDVATFDHSNVESGSYNQYTVDLSAYSSFSNVWVRFVKSSSTTSPWRLDDIQVFCGPSVEAPQISVTPAGNYAFGNQLVSSSSAAANFTITNTGTLDLTLGTIALSGTNADQFSVTPAGSATVNPAGSTSFNVVFSPTSTGVKSATVTIPNNTAAPYTFNVSGTGILNTAPNNASISKTCIANIELTLQWAAPTSGVSPTGYIVYALQGTTAPAMVSNLAGNASSYAANGDFSSANVYGSLGRAVFKGNATTAVITGLTTGQQYTFKVVAYNGETATGWASGINNSGSWNATYTVKVPEVDNPSASAAPTSSAVSWTVVPASSGCYEYLVVANQGTVVFTPSGDGSAYTANSVYSAANQVVYKGTGNSVTATGLTEGMQYCYKIFVREVNSSQWSEGVSVCRTTGLSYCDSYGNTDFGTGITGVEFNTINNLSAPGDQPDYSDYTALSTAVSIGQSYDLSVKVNTDGNYKTAAKVWIDWNRSGTFEVSTEEYDLGTAVNVADGYTTNSPLIVTVPASAQPGMTRMRISNKYDSAATPCESGYDGEVEDYTIEIVKPANAEINIKGGSISIPSGSTEVNALNNTLFAATDLGSSSVEKTFTIENLGQNILTLTGSPAVKLVGDHPADFTITEQPASTTVGTNGSVTFKVKFNPVTADVRSAVVSISNDDPTGSENPYTFRIQGKGQCAAVPAITVLPASGPAHTVVTLTSAVNDLTGAEVRYNGVTLVPLSVNTGEIKIKIPAGAEDGNLTVRLKTGCVFTQAFDVVTYENTGCEGAATGSLPTDLIIYEVNDEEKLSGGYISIYNGTSSAKNLANYNIYREGKVYVSGFSGILNTGAVAVLKVNTGTQCAVPASTGNGTVNGGFNDSDNFELTDINGTVIYDKVVTPGYVGYYMIRKPGMLGNYTTYDTAAWDTTAVANNVCIPSAGSPGLPAGTVPHITQQPSFVPNCQNITLSVAAEEGVAAGKALAYQWYSLAPGASSWAVVVDSGIYSGATTDVLRIASAAGLGDYQYYAQVREDGAACYTASHAVQVEDTATSWTGTGWSNGLPTPVSRVVINGDYDTALHGDFTACSLEVSAGSHLKVRKGNVVTVVYDIINKAPAEHVVIESDANLIQLQDDAPANTGPVTLQRNARMKRLDYTYWSSPVTGQNLKAFSPGTLNNRFYTYNEWDDKFTDINPQVNNFTAARGYAIRASNLYPAGSATVPAPVQNFQGVFKGVPNNGVITVGVEKSTAGNGHNLVGNPYPSNIDFYALADHNAGVIHKKAYFWTNMNPNPAMQGSNYPTPVAGVVYYNNYAVLNGTGGIPATINDVDPSDSEAIKSATPTRFVRPGQGFIVQALNNGVLGYTNAVRSSNAASVFFNNKTSGSDEAADRFWLHLKTPLNVMTTQLIGYLPNAGPGFDSDYDAELPVVGSDAFYSVLEDRKLGIQGKGVFVQTDVVPLGSSHDAEGIFSIHLGEREGVFAEGQPIYLKDRQTGTISDLTKGSYSFTAGSGINEGRFEIVYQPQTVLSADGTAQEAMIVFRDRNDFVVRSTYHRIAVLEVFDASGRLVYRNLPLSVEARISGDLLVNGLYLVKTELDNGENFVRKIKK